MKSTSKFSLVVCAATFVAISVGANVAQAGLETPTPPAPTARPPSTLKSNIIISKSAGKSTAIVGDAVSFSIAVTCTGDTECGNVSFSDVVPANFQVTGASASTGNIAVSGQSITWQKGLMLQRETAIITVNTKAVSGGCACNVVQANASAPNNPNDDRAEACVCVGQPTPTAAPPAPGPTATPVPPPAPLPVTGGEFPVSALAAIVAGLMTGLAGLLMRKNK